MLNENETLQMSMFSPLGYETPTADSFVASLDKDEVAKYTEYWQSVPNCPMCTNSIRKKKKCRTQKIYVKLLCLSFSKSSEILQGK